jgi:cytochrome c-type biogenesis protein CcmH/NrfF
MRARLLVPLLLLAAALPAAAQAQPTTTDGERAAAEAIRQIRSPYCPGLMLEVCPSTPAEAMRDSIREMAAAGVPPRAIVEDFIARHGEEWRAVPKRTGAGLWAWIIPPFALLLGGVFLAGRLRAMRGRGSDAHRPPEALGADEESALSADDRAQLEEALREWDAREEAGL